MIIFIFQVVLFLWFLGCITSYRTSKWTLVDGVGIKSAEFGMMCFYVTGVILFHAFNVVGKWFLFAVLFTWIVVQFFCHWYFTIFGASDKKLKGYNECFRDSIRIIPVSDIRIVPDLYHIVLHTLLVINFVSLIVSIVS